MRHSDVLTLGGKISINIKVFFKCIFQEVNHSISISNPKVTYVELK